MNPTRPTISLIICTKDRAKDLLRTISSVLTQTVRPDELVIVDAGNETDLEQQIRDMVEGVLQLVFLRSEPGLTIQRNFGVTNSTGDIISFIDDDVILNCRYLEAILASFEEDQTEVFGAILSRITNYHPNPPTLIEKAKDVVIRLILHLFMLPSLGKGNLKKSGFPSFPHHRTQKSTTDCLSGCSMSFRRKVFPRVTFDELLGGYAFMEDVDSARQLKASGFAILYEPASRLEHHPSPTSRMSQQNLAEMSILNHHYLFLKHSTFSPGEIAAFVWSLAGLLLLSLPNTARRTGTIHGLIRILQAPTKVRIGSTKS